MKILFVALSVSLLFMTSCSEKESNKTDKKEEKIVKISGSDSERYLVELLTKRFAQNSNYIVEGGGSGIGIKKLIYEKFDIANSSREVTKAEIDSAEKKGIVMVPVVIAMDALAMITNLKTGVDSLSTIQIQRVLSGEIKNWKELGGIDREIVIFGRNKESGTFKFVQETFLQGENFPKNTKVLKTNQEIVDSVKDNPAGIGYVGVAFVKNEFNQLKEGIWPINIYVEGEDEAYSPMEDQRVMDGSYPIVRPLYQYFNGFPEGALRKFVEFELSQEGQDIIFQYGYFPISSEFEAVNKLEGF